MEAQAAVRRDPGRLVVAGEALALTAAVAVGILDAPAANWNLPFLFVLLGFALVSDFVAARIRSEKLKFSGSFLAIVLAIVLLGATPACIIGVATILIGWLKWRERAHYLLNNVVAYAWFPLIGGLFFEAVRDAGGLEPSDRLFSMLVFATFAVALAVNFLVVAGYAAYIDGERLWTKIRKVLFVLLPSELAAALLAVGIAYLASRTGPAAIALSGFVLLTFQNLLGKMLLFEERADDLAVRTEQLASFQLGLLSALLHTLDLRDRMTARHSAAVARYAQEIARAAGLPEDEQELVHTAALLHDIGKFVFPDRILEGDPNLSESDWEIIRQHPADGAKVLSHVDGYGSVAEIVLAHHERIDGKGYPRGVKGEEIPELARIISVADTYDVLTARDSYREPRSSFQAIQELQRVAGTQLDRRFVDVFIEVLAGKDLRYRHGEDTDFDAELELERRVFEYGAGRASQPA